MHLSAVVGQLPARMRERAHRLLRRARSLAGPRFEPPELPTRLPGSLWAVTSFFNPAGYHNKLANYRRFREELSRQDVPLLAVELAFGDRAFELRPEDADRLLQYRSDVKLWHKERLLNIGIAALPDDCDKVTWLDADLIFQNPLWPHDVAERLERYVSLQPFECAVRLPPGEQACTDSDLKHGFGDGQRRLSMACGLVGQRAIGPLEYVPERDGHAGFAWAARRSFLQAHGLYDRCPLGGADLQIALAMYGAVCYRPSARLNPRAVEHCAAWARKTYADVRGSVSFSPGLVCHLWHGTRKDRRYADRLKSLFKNDFDPERDLGFDASGMLTWTSDKLELHRRCAEYFASRREEEGASR